MEPLLPLRRETDFFPTSGLDKGSTRLALSLVISSSRMAFLVALLLFAILLSSLNRSSVSFSREDEDQLNISVMDFALEATAEVLAPAPVMGGVGFTCSDLLLADAAEVETGAAELLAEAEADDLSTLESTSDTTCSLALEIVGIKCAVRRLCCLTVSS
jgi:hypothetical protein